MFWRELCLSIHGPSSINFHHYGNHFSTVHEISSELYEINLNAYSCSPEDRFSDFSAVVCSKFHFVYLVYDKHSRVSSVFVSKRLACCVAKMTCWADNYHVSMLMIALSTPVATYVLLIFHRSSPRGPTTPPLTLRPPATTSKTSTNVWLGATLTLRTWSANRTTCLGRMSSEW